MLTLEDFLKFYTEKSIANVDVVWQNLNAHGIGHDLQLEFKEKEDITALNDPLLTKDQSQLPRSFISQDVDKLNCLFSLEIDEARDKIWRLIGSLQTNPMLMSQILSGDLQVISPNQPVLKLLYCLQILKNYLNGYSLNQITGKCKLFLEKSKKLTNNYEEDYPVLLKNNEQGGNMSLGANNYENAAIPLPAADMVEEKVDQKLSYNWQQIMSWKGDIKEEELKPLDETLTSD